MKKFLLDIETNLAATILFLAFLVVGLGVIARDVLSISLLWTEELSRIFLIYIVFLAGSGAIATKTHFRVELLEMILPKRASAALSLVFDIVTVGLLIFLIYAGLLQVQRDYMVPSLVLQWPSSVFTFALPLAAVFMVFRVIQTANTHFRSLVGTAETQEIGVQTVVDGNNTADPAEES
ncbi:MAG: TRAP transporter small permease [Rhodospirillales bacterium]|nr:TRAP transporter small permease [Rhodospirillales bacterium]